MLKLYGTKSKVFSEKKAMNSIELLIIIPDGFMSVDVLLQIHLDQNLNLNLILSA